MEKLAVRKGQLAVTLAELNEKADNELDVVACVKTFEKAVTLWQSTDPFASRLLVSCVCKLMLEAVHCVHDT